MKNPLQHLPSTRREFLRRSGSGIGLLAFSQFAPGFLVSSTLAANPAPEKDRSILVLVQLAGGNDGLNTVVPYGDDLYYKLRPGIGLKKADLLDLDGQMGFHSAMAGMHRLHQDGKLAVVQNVGYPNPNRSHFRSTEIWETASDSDDYALQGWVGRYLDNTCSGTPNEDPMAVHLTNEVPQSFLAAEDHQTFGLVGGGRNPKNKRKGGEDERALKLLERIVGDEHEHDDSNGTFLQQTMLDALVTERRVQDVLANDKVEAKYPGTEFARSLSKVAAMIAGGFSTRVYFVSLGGFDTHANQATQHQRLLQELSAGLAAFQRDLETRKLDDQVTTMTFSEFGRRPNENKSGGTDHGTAAPLFVMGKKVKGGLHGTAPSLQLEKNRDLKFSTDFRQVYSTVLGRWMDCPDPNAVLGGDFAPLDFMA